MVKITEELVRKKAEHNECIINSLEELSLHQEDVEKIENINNWCKNLQILYFQSNLISKIENLNKLKNLQYLNLALNNIEKIENLERCESLEKLDLTLNFIGDLQSVKTLKNNIHLKHLYLTGNPCADFDGYRIFVIAHLQQLETFDNREITRSEKIKALQLLPKIEEKIHHAEEEYKVFRSEQKVRLESLDEDIDEETYWKSSSEHAPETRVEMSRRSRKAKGKDEEKITKEKKMVAVFNRNGRAMNINEAKLQFKFDDFDPAVFILDIAVYKHLDTCYIDVDLQPIYVRVLIKSKVFQFVFPEEIYTDKSTAQRSQITGHLVLTMPRVNYEPKKHKKEVLKSKEKTETTKGPEFLEVTPPTDESDFSKIIENGHHFVDNPDVPPLEYG